MKPPKEYAKELVEKYESATRSYLSEPTDSYEVSFLAKQCALIDVQNTIEALNEITPKIQIIWHFEQVKTEIINLK